MTVIPEILGHDPETAKMLLDVKAVNFRPEEPYIFTAGWASPVYIDCRKIISFPNVRNHIMAKGRGMLRSRGVMDNLDFIAGGETAGIPYAAWMAQDENAPMLYVRKKPKGFGRDAQIEGDPKPGAKVLLVEDLATDGGSKFNFINAIRMAGMTVADIFVVFFYGIFPGSLDGLKAQGVGLHFLATWWDVLRVAEEGEYFSSKANAEVRKFLANPINWSAAHGGRGSMDKIEAG